MAIVLLTLVAPSMAMQVEAASPIVGKVLIETDKSKSDSAVINLSGVAPASEGSTYQVALKSNDGRQVLNIGSINVVADIVHGIVQSTGSGSLIFDNNFLNKLNYFNKFVWYVAKCKRADLQAESFHYHIPTGNASGEHSF